jgi:hypothetical protein
MGKQQVQELIKLHNVHIATEEGMTEEQQYR